MGVIGGVSGLRGGRCKRCHLGRILVSMSPKEES